MAKRRTIGENPLDAIMPDPGSPVKERRPAQATPATVQSGKGTVTPTQATRTASQAQEDLLGRIRSVEEQSELTKWLVYGAIALAILL